MNFRKIICGLMSLILVFSSEMSVNAMPMKNILGEMDEMGYFGKNEALDKIRDRTLKFLQDERKKKLSRSDSLAFALFCYLCVCEKSEEKCDIEAALNRACASRNLAEHIEDMAVINDILPHNVYEFAERFGIWLDEKKRLELSQYVGRYVARPISPEESYQRYSCNFLDETYRKDRKPQREVREEIREGMKLAKDVYDDDEDYEDDECYEDDME